MTTRTDLENVVLKDQTFTLPTEINDSRLSVCPVCGSLEIDLTRGAHLSVSTCANGHRWQVRPVVTRFNFLDRSIENRVCSLTIGFCTVAI